MTGFAKKLAVFVVSICVTCVVQTEGARAEKQKILIDGVAAHVNEHIITIGDVTAVFQPVRRQLYGKYEGNELQARLRKAYEAALNSLIERRLIIDSYEKQEMSIPEWVVNKRINEIIHEMFKDDRMELMAVLSRERLTFDEWRDEIQDHIIVSSMRGLNVEQNIKVSPRAVSSFYERNIEKYRIPKKVRLRMIVFKKGVSRQEVVLKRRQAEDIRKRAISGEDFAMLARNLSEGNRAADGGDRGWIEPKILRPELAKAVSDLKPAKISEVIETKEELYILKIEGWRNKSVTSFEEVHPQIERELRQKEAKLLYKDWIDRLRKDAYVKVFDVDLF